MLYSFDVTIPAGTLEASAVELLAEMAPGIITQVEVIVPEGVAGFAFSRALYANHPLWPANAGAAFTGDGWPIRWEGEWPLLREPLALRLFGWAPNARFSHTITWRFALREAAYLEGDQAPTGLLSRIADALGLGGGAESEPPSEEEAVAGEEV